MQHHTVNHTDTQTHDKQTEHTNTQAQNKNRKQETRIQNTHHTTSHHKTRTKHMRPARGPQTVNIFLLVASQQASKQQHENMPPEQKCPLSENKCTQMSAQVRCYLSIIHISSVF